MPVQTILCPTQACPSRQNGDEGAGYNVETEGVSDRRDMLEIRRTKSFRGGNGKAAWSVGAWIRGLCLLEGV